jgi:hypothetical protein
MSHSPSNPVGRTDSMQSDPTVQEPWIRSSQPTQRGFAFGERPFFQPLHDESDDDAVCAWESEGGAPSNLKEELKPPSADADTKVSTSG